VPDRPLPDLATRLASYETLVDISRLLLVSVTPEELFDRISSELNRLVPVDALTIYRVDEVAGEIVPVHARDEWADEIMAAPLRLGEGLTGWVVEQREAANVTAAERDPRIAVVPGTPDDESEAIISVPLIVRDTPIGALNTYRLGEGVAFSPQEFELVRHFADLAALALDNTQNRIRLTHEAQTDWLTGLHNHRFYHERLHDELDRAERYGRPLSLIVFDLDSFKLGGEEFAIILPETGKRAARAAAERLCARVRALPGLRATTVSCGVASFPADAGDAIELVAGADAALYAAKARGKDRAVSFTSAVLARRARQSAGDGHRPAPQPSLLTALADGLDRIAAAASRGASSRTVGQQIVQVVCDLTGAAGASIVVEPGQGRRHRVLAAQGTPAARSVCLAAALAPDAGASGLAVLCSCDFPAVSAEAARRHADVATAPLGGHRLTVTREGFPEAVRAAIAAIAAQGGLALEHADALARLRGAGESSGLRRAGA
jgi:GGDEF domain-containing protein